MASYKFLYKLHQFLQFIQKLHGQVHCFFSSHRIAFHFLSCIVLLYSALFLFSFLIFSLLATSSIKLNLNLTVIKGCDNCYSPRIDYQLIDLSRNSIQTLDRTPRKDATSACRCP